MSTQKTVITADNFAAQTASIANQPQPGRLKIFLGYAPGVGKTAAMLGAAQQAAANGLAVVAGYIDRPELAANLELIPPTPIQVGDHHLHSLNLDGLLARRPQVVLVDNLSAPNPPGARHPKRYQDVLELLEAGLDVYTTLNIQHLDSLNDIVAQITGTVERDTVPDRLLDQAAAVQVVDLPVEELYRRFQAGQVYFPGHMARAGQKFFRPGNLTALRELMLRRTAEYVDAQMRAYMRTHAIAGPWPAAERLLVCVGPSPLSERLVRATRRLAVGLNAEWFAVYVDTPGQTRLPDESRERVARTLQLAENLGGKAFTLTGRSVAETAAHFARERNITKIIIGKPLRPRWADLLRGSLVDQVIRRSRNVDVYVISSATPDSPPIKIPHPTPLWPWSRYAGSAGLVALATLVGYPLRLKVEPTNLVMLYLLAVVLAAVRLGRRPAILTSVLSVAAFNLFFVPPYFTYLVHDAQYLLTFAALLVVGVVISTLAAQAREQARAAQQREAQTAALYELSRSLAGAVEAKTIAQAVVNHLDQTLDSPAAIFLAHAGHLSAEPGAAGHGFLLTEAEFEAARWAFDHLKPAGRHTDTLPQADAAYLPLVTARGAVGVLGIGLGRRSQPLAPEQRRLLDSFAGQAAQALERVHLAEQVGQVQLLRETEKLQTALLNSISHDLRTPLASITGALSSLRLDAPYLDEPARSDLVNTAWEQADRLNNLVGNLLGMTRLEAGAIKLKPELCDLQDVVGVALAQLEARLKNRHITVDISAGLPLVPLDMVLLAQALVNLLDNVLKYAPADTAIEIKGGVSGQEARLEIADYGPGIPEEDLERVFDKFYRAPRPESIGGTGLGLSICRGIVEAHHGHIWAKNRPQGGAVITIALPLTALPDSAPQPPVQK